MSSGLVVLLADMLLCKKKYITLLQVQPFLQWASCFLLLSGKIKLVIPSQLRGLRFDISDPKHCLRFRGHSDRLDQGEGVDVDHKSKSHNIRSSNIPQKAIHQSHEQGQAWFTRKIRWESWTHSLASGSPPPPPYLPCTLAARWQNLSCCPNKVFVFF